MRRKGLTFFLGLSLILLTASISLAAGDRSQLLATIDAYGRPWVRSCNGTSCGSWTMISGVLTQVPTAVWDEDYQKYYLYGIVSDGTIWRCSFDPDGTWNEDWTQTGGSSDYPIAAASGGRFSNYNVSQATSYEDLTTTVSNIRSITNMYAPQDGYIACTGTGTIYLYRSSSSASSEAFVYLTTTSAGTSSEYTKVFLPNDYPSGATWIPFSIARSFSVSPGDYNFYLTAKKDVTGTDPGTIRVYNTNLTCVYYPYKE